MKIIIYLFMNILQGESTDLTFSIKPNMKTLINVFTKLTICNYSSIEM